MRLKQSLSKHIRECGEFKSPRIAINIGSKMKSAGVSKEVILSAIRQMGFNMPQSNLIYLKIERPTLFRPVIDVTKLKDKMRVQLMRNKSLSTRTRWYMPQGLYEQLCTEVKITKQTYRGIKIVIKTRNDGRVELK